MPPIWLQVLLILVAGWGLRHVTTCNSCKRSTLGLLIALASVFTLILEILLNLPWGKY